MATKRTDWTAGEKITRRGLLGVGVVGAAAGVGVVAWPSSGKAHSSGPWLIGSVDRVESDRIFYLTRVHDDGPAVRVELADGASVLKEGTATLADFEPGDEVGVGGEWREDGSYLAFTVESTFRLLDAEVQAVDGEMLVTADGNVALTDGTEPRAAIGPEGQAIEARPVDEIEPGDRVMVLGRRPGAVDDHLRAVLIGTYE